MAHDKTIQNHAENRYKALRLFPEQVVCTQGEDQPQWVDYETIQSALEGIASNPSNYIRHVDLWPKRVSFT